MLYEVITGEKLRMPTTFLTPPASKPDFSIADSFLPRMRSVSESTCGVTQSIVATRRVTSGWTASGSSDRSRAARASPTNDRTRAQTCGRSPERNSVV